jgi:hypothetical protein
MKSLFLMLILGETNETNCMKFKAAIITFLTLLTVYFPLTFMISLFGHAAAWNGSKNVFLSLLGKLFYPTSLGLIVNCILFSVTGASIVFVLINRKKFQRDIEKTNRNQ